MEYIKRNFMKLSIERQIQLGVTSVTCCIAILVLVLTIVNSLILMNLQYLDFLSILDQLENETIENISFYYENDARIISDMEKVQLTTISNFMNIHKKFNFIESFVNLPTENIVKQYQNDPIKENVCDNPNNCIVYQRVWPINNDIDNQIIQYKPEFKKFLEALYLCYPLLDLAYNSIGLNIDISKESLRMIQSVIIYSPDIQVLTYYPHTANRNNSLIASPGKTSLLENKYIRQIDYEAVRQMGIYSISYMYQNESYKGPYPDLISPEYIFQNPISSYILDIAINQDFVCTTNLKYKQSFNTSVTGNWMDLNNLEEMYVANWGVDMVEKNVYEHQILFDGIKVLLTQRDSEESLINYHSCLYFLKFYHLYNKLSFNVDNYNYTNMRNIYDCFPYDEGRKNINQYFNYSNTDTYPGIYSRRVHFNLINSTVSNLLVKYKIYKIPIPGIYSENILPSKFSTHTLLYIYIFKNESFNKMYYDYFFIKIFEHIMVVIMYNLSVWYVITLLVIYQLRKVTGIIIDPINLLINHIGSLGDNTKLDSKETEDKIELIQCKDDTDIDDLFIICKGLIRGGFQGNQEDNTNKVKSDKLLSGSYNNIAYIKTNNLVVKEDLIEKTTNSDVTAFIFDFDEDNEEKKFNDLLNNETLLVNSNLNSRMNIGSNLNTNNNNNSSNLCDNQNVNNYQSIKLKSKIYKTSFKPSKKSIFKKDKNFDIMDEESEKRENTKKDLLTIIGAVFKNKNPNSNYLKTMLSNNSTYQDK